MLSVRLDEDDDNELLKTVWKDSVFYLHESVYTKVIFLLQYHVKPLLEFKNKTVLYTRQTMNFVSSYCNNWFMMTLMHLFGKSEGL